MANELPNIEYLSDNTPTIDSPSSMFVLPFEKREEYFSNFESKVRFLKGCEKLVRKDIRYKKYINYLKRKVKLNKCQVIRGLTDKDCTIEMHHGPIFTLFDLCEIVLDYYLRKNKKVTTFMVADEVLKEHCKNHIHVVMVSITAHQEIHDREIFIHTNQAWGDINKFIKRFGLSKDMKEKYNRYLDRCEMMGDSSAYEIFQLNPKLTGDNE